MTRTPVAVLGAGPMGLAAAYQLARDGNAPVVFEADDRLGGMTASFDFDGLRIERFYHFHCTSDVDLLMMLDELGIADAMRWVSTKMGYFVDGRLHPWGTPLSLLRFPRLRFVDKVRCGIHAFASTRRDDWSDLDRRSAQAWMRDWVGERAFDVLWKQLFALKFHHHADDLSAAWIWSRIRRLGRSRDRLFRERLGYVAGGSETLLGAMAADITRRGGEIRLSTPVTRVVLDGGEVRGVETPGGFERFDKVVSTIPLPYVSRVFGDLPAALRAKYDALPYIAVVCVIVKLRRPLTDCFWLNISDASIDAPGLVEYSNLNPLREHVVYVPYYLPAEHPKYKESDEAFIEGVRRHLRRINPALEDADFLHARASRYRYAQPICAPRFLDRLPPMKPAGSGLVIADTSYYYPEDRGISESIGLGRKMARMVHG